MSSWSVVRWTGVLGLAEIIVLLVAFLVSFDALLLERTEGWASATFDDANKVLDYVKDRHFGVTTSLILFFIGFSLFIGFLAGLRAIAVAAAPDQEWLATAALGAGLATTVMALVALGLALAAFAIAVSSHADAAMVRMLVETSGVVGGPPGLVPMAFFLGAAGSLGATTKILPRWLALVGWIGSILVLISAFSAYGASDPNTFWSANGYVNILAGLPLVVWTLGASVVFVRQKAGVVRVYR
jgi:hypothetical protein